MDKEELLLVIVLALFIFGVTYGMAIGFNG